MTPRYNVKAVGSVVAAALLAWVVLAGAWPFGGGGGGEARGGGAFDPLDAGELLAFVPVAPAGEGPAFQDAEVTDPAALGSYLAPMPAAVAGSVRDQLRGWEPAPDGDRLFAFRIRGQSSAKEATLIMSQVGVGAERLFARLIPVGRPDDGQGTDFLAIFAVSSRELAAPPASEGELAAFVELGANPAGPSRVEVTDPAALQGFLAGLDGTAASSLRAQLSDRDPARDADRLVAFVLRGCAETTAVLSIERDGAGPGGRGLYALHASLAAGHRAECPVPTYFAAVFAIPDEKFPL